MYGWGWNDAPTNSSNTWKDGIKEETMVEQNIIKSRLINKHDIEANWLKADTFIPKKGELIIYDSEVDSEGNILELPAKRNWPYLYERVKIGNGRDFLKDLKFYSTEEGSGEIKFIKGWSA
jgi:hypothetical protein